METLNIQMPSMKRTKSPVNVSKGGGLMRNMSFDMSIDLSATIMGASSRLLDASSKMNESFRSSARRAPDSTKSLGVKRTASGNRLFGMQRAASTLQRSNSVSGQKGGLLRSLSSKSVTGGQRPGLQTNKSSSTLTSMTEAAITSMRSVTGGRRKLTSASSSGVGTDAPLNIFASDIVSTDFILGRIEEVKADPRIVKVEVEDLITSANSGQLIPVFRDLLASGDRDWVSVLFVDSLPADQFRTWQSLKTDFMGDIDDILDTPVHGKQALNSGAVTVQANVEIASGTTLKAFVSLMRGIRRHKGVCKAEFAGALFGYSEESIIEGLDRCFNAENELSEMVCIQVACGWEVEDNWARHLEACVRAVKDLRDYRAAKTSNEETPILRRAQSTGASLDQLVEKRERSPRRPRSSSARNLAILMNVDDSTSSTRPALRRNRSGPALRRMTTDEEGSSRRQRSPRRPRSSSAKNLTLLMNACDDQDSSGRPALRRNQSSGPALRRQITDDDSSGRKPRRTGIMIAPVDEPARRPELRRNKSGPAMMRRTVTAIDGDDRSRPRLAKQGSIKRCESSDESPPSRRVPRRARSSSSKSLALELRRQNSAPSVQDISVQSSERKGTGSSVENSVPKRGLSKRRSRRSLGLRKGGSRREVTESPPPLSRGDSKGNLDDEPTYDWSKETSFSSAVEAKDDVIERAPSHDWSQGNSLDGDESSSASSSEEAKHAEVVASSNRGKKSLIDKFVGTLKSSSEVESAGQSLTSKQTCKLSSEANVTLEFPMADESGPDFEWKKPPVCREMVDASYGSVSIDDSCIDHSCMDTSLAFSGMDTSLALNQKATGMDESLNPNMGGLRSLKGDNHLLQIFNDSTVGGMSHVFNDSHVGMFNDSCVFASLAAVTPGLVKEETAVEERKKKRREKREDQVIEEEEEEDSDSTSDTDASSKLTGSDSSDSDSSDDEDAAPYYDWTLGMRVSKPRSESAGNLSRRSMDGKGLARSSSSRSQSRSQGDLRRRVNSSHSMGSKKSSGSLSAMADHVRSARASMNKSPTRVKRIGPNPSAAMRLMASVDSASTK